LKNLKNVQLASKDGVVGYFPINGGRVKEVVAGFLKQLAAELGEHSPVRNIINQYAANHKSLVFGKYVESIYKTGGEVAVIEKHPGTKDLQDFELKMLESLPVANFTRTEYHDVNWYRRLKKAHKRNGQLGVVEYLIVLARRFSLPNKDTLEYKNLTAEKIEEYKRVAHYFNGLISLVTNGMLPVRDGSSGDN